MALLFALVAFAFAACGAGLTGLGLTLSLGGQVRAGLLSAACGLMTLYGAYLFGRASQRVRAQLRETRPTAAESNDRRTAVWQTLGFAALLVAFYIVLPLPRIVRVIAAVCVLLIVPLILARDFEPPKRKRPGPRG